MHVPQPITAATGEAGENRALYYLQARGLTAVNRNHHCKGDEIDLAMRGAAGALVFAELRARVTRSTQHFGGVATGVTPTRQHRLIVAAEGSLAWQVKDVPAYRFDVIVTDGTRIEWMRDVFGADA